jgi:hypothetical protein
MSKKRLKQQTSRVMRVQEATYNRINSIKAPYCSQHKLKKCTYDMILGEALNVAELLLAGEELYLVDGSIFTDLAEARGASIRAAVKAGTPPTWPVVLLRVGQDEGLSRG